MEVFFISFILRKIPRIVLMWGELVRGIESINTITRTDIQYKNCINGNKSLQSCSNSLLFQNGPKHNPNPIQQQ